MTNPFEIFWLKDPDCKVPHLHPITKYRSIQQSGFHDSQCSQSPCLDPQDGVLVRCAVQTHGGQPEDCSGLIPFSRFHLMDSIFHNNQVAPGLSTLQGSRKLCRWRWSGLGIGTCGSCRWKPDIKNLLKQATELLLLERMDCVENNLKKWDRPQK